MMNIFSVASATKTSLIKHSMEHVYLVYCLDTGINKDAPVTLALKDINIVLLKKNVHALKNIHTLIWTINVSAVILQTFGI